MSTKLLVTILLVVLGFYTVSAHGDAHELIQEINKQLETDPDNPELYFNRAVLYQSHNDFNQAFLDYEKARELEPENSYIDHNLSKLCLDNDLGQMALSYAEAFLNANPGHIKGLVRRGQIFRYLGRYEEAISDLEMAISSPEAVAEYYLLIAEITMEEDPTAHSKAISYYRKGQANIGDLTAFRKGIIEMEMSRGNLTNALVETELLIERSARKERWYILKGKILSEAGEKEKAAQAYLSAKTAIERLSPTRKNTDYIRDLEAEIELALAQFH